MPATALISPSHRAQSQPAPADHQSPAGSGLTLQADPALAMLGEVPEQLCSWTFLCNHSTVRPDIRDSPEGAITPTTSGWGGTPAPAPFGKYS